MTTVRTGVDARPPLKMRVSSEPIALTLQQMKGFIFRPAVLAQWIGPDTGIAPLAGRYVALPEPDGSIRRGRVLEVIQSAGALEIAMGEFPDPREVVRLRITAALDDDRYSRITVVERGLVDAATVRVRLRLWQGAINKLVEIVLPLARRREPGQERSRQAVIIVHGMGEQSAGATLDAFTQCLFGKQRELGYTKPYPKSSLFDLRKKRFPAKRNRPVTDVYELYWAHLIRDTTSWQTLSWLLGLVWKTRMRRVPKPLRWLVWVARLLWVGVVGASLFLAERGFGAHAWGGALVGAIIFFLGLGWALTKHGLINTLGDVARYVQPKPDNVAVRQKIRDAGVDLLETLHESGEYDRIVVVGHSLGSVIAYDVVTYAWIKWGRRHQYPDTTRGRALRAVESSVVLPDAAATSDEARAAAVSNVRSLQFAAWCEYRENGMPWLVTDLITAGSPLCHARILLARDKSTGFDELAQDRVFPLCPPHTELAHSPVSPKSSGKPDRGVFTYVRAYRDLSTGQRKSVLVPHHAGLFALTRWTNLYFPYRWGIKGDPVAGPLVPVFGWWVKDRALAQPKSGFGGFAHTLYWTSNPRSDEHVKQLRQALDLGVSADLNSLATRVPLNSASLTEK